MSILNLPDEILVNIFDKYLNLDQLEALHSTCIRFSKILDQYDQIYRKFLFKSPIIDYNYPIGKILKSIFFIL